MQALIDTVQHNCHISDAQYAGNYTLCIYLLKMREFYRWEKRLSFLQKLENDDIGQWLTQREALWDEIDEQPLRNIPIGEQHIDAFDSSAINQALNDQQLVYSGGYGLYGKPVFFLAEMEHRQQLDDYTLYIAGRELARDLAAPPGMAQDRTVFIRRESLRRFIWEKFEESHWHKQENPLARALACYDFKQQPEASLEAMTDREVDTVLQHEIGEILAGRELGSEWEDMLMDLPRSQAEIMVRAIRDNIADMLNTLPRLIERNEPAQLHFYFANISSMRKTLFPRLQQAYQHWLQNGHTRDMQSLIPQGTEHWTGLAQEALKLYRQHGNTASSHIEALINNNTL